MYDRKTHSKKVYDTMCMTQNMGAIFFENWGVWHNMYDTKKATLHLAKNEKCVTEWFANVLKVFCRKLHTLKEHCLIADASNISLFCCRLKYISKKFLNLFFCKMQVQQKVITISTHRQHNTTSLVVSTCWLIVWVRSEFKTTEHYRGTLNA